MWILERVKNTFWKTTRKQKKEEFYIFHFLWDLANVCFDLMKFHLLYFASRLKKKWRRRTSASLISLWVWLSDAAASRSSVCNKRPDAALRSSQVQIIYIYMWRQSDRCFKIYLFDSLLKFALSIQIATARANAHAILAASQTL